jgi:hypothetical protein
MRKHIYAFLFVAFLLACGVSYRHAKHQWAMFDGAVLWDREDWTECEDCA